MPRFTPEAREAPGEMGGLLKLYRANGDRVRFVGWCPGGALGIDGAGVVVWVENWRHMSGVSVSGKELRLEGRPADIDTGKLLKT